MATHCNILACRIPRTEEPDGLLSKESQRVTTIVHGVTQLQLVTEHSSTHTWSPRCLSPNWLKVSLPSPVGLP